MSPDIGDLDLLCHEYLDACVEALDTIPVFDPGLAGAPDRSFVSPGASADDCCPQLTVWAERVTESPSSPGFTTGVPSCERINLVTLIARIVRCLPGMQENGNFPNADALEAAATQKDADGWALWNHVFNQHCAGLLFEECGEVHWDGLSSVNPSGGCAGWQLQVRASLGGYQETFGT